MKLILASNSRTRKEVLDTLGLKYTVIPSDIIENSDKTDPKDYVMDLSRQKALAVSKNLKEGVILSGDSIIYIDNKKLEKPKTKEQAREMLKSLSGKVNYAVTGVTIIDLYQNKTITLNEVTEVYFDELSKSKLKVMSYLQLKDFLSKVDPIVKFELYNNLLANFNDSINQRAYINANMENFKHIDWARNYCFLHNLCPVSPQNILPLHFYEGDEKKYSESRLELLRRTDRILLFIDRNNLSDDLNRLDPYSLSEIYYVDKYLKDKTIELIGWDEALVPKYNQNNKWSLTTNEDIVIRKILK